MERHECFFEWLRSIFLTGLAHALHQLFNISLTSHSDLSGNNMQKISSSIWFLKKKLPKWKKKSLIYSNFPRNYSHAGELILGTSMVHFALSLMHSHTQNLCLELCTPAPVVPFVSLCLAYFFFPFMCTESAAWLNFSHLKTDCFCNMGKLCSQYLRFLFWSTSDSAARNIHKGQQICGHLYNMYIVINHVTVLFWMYFGKIWENIKI